MKTHKIELTFAGIFLIIYLIMVGINKQVETNEMYWIILEICLIASIFLVSRVAWEKFKKTLE